MQCERRSQSTTTFSLQRKHLPTLNIKLPAQFYLRSLDKLFNQAPQPIDTGMGYLFLKSSQTRRR